MGLVENVKKRVQVFRKSRGLSVYELAVKSELTEACIRNWYTKRNYTPSLEAIEKICKALNISPVEFVRDENDRFRCVNEEENKLLDGWICLNEKQKMLIFMQIENFLEKK